MICNAFHLQRVRRGVQAVIIASTLYIIFLLSTTSDHRLVHISPGDLFDTHSFTISAPQRRAYATFLSTRVTKDGAEDPYFTATRVLNFQLQHAPETRTTAKTPFVVLITENVSPAKRGQLIAEGATVILVELLKPKVDWLKPGEVRFVDQFTKLRLFELTQFDQILYLDNDMLLTKPLDSIWNEPAARQGHLPLSPPPDGRRHADEGVLPLNYSIVGVSDTHGAAHKFPPPESDVMNGGFMMLRPSKAVFDYYVSLLNIPNLFPSNLMEQSLLNYAHRRGGSMPWKAFKPGKWNVNWPRLTDVQGGAATLHDKFWEKKNKEWIDRELIEMWWRVRGQMEGYWLSKNSNDPQ